ncbi:MAG: hypothetical protein AB7S75_22815 [Desulfococcaceae bacterium]
MEKNLKTGGTKGLDSGLTALQSLRHVICSEPRMLTESEIKLLRQSKSEIARRISELLAAGKQVRKKMTLQKRAEFRKG